MKKNIKTIGALALVIVLVLAMSVTAFAADGDSLLHDGLNSSSKTVTILKEITAYNPDSSVVNEPTATYTYAVTAGAADISITDKDGYNAVTYAGVTTGVTLTSTTDNTAGADTTLTYGPASATLNTAAGGETNNKEVTIDFSNVNFGHPGVFRYVITETASIYDGSNGVVSAGTNGTNVRYLDVYVKTAAGYNASSATPANNWEIYGYALFTDGATAIVEENQTGGNESTLYKTTGFVADSTNGVAADSYYTFNVTIGKTVANDPYVMALHTQFPFTVQFVNATVTEAVLPTVSTSANYAAVGAVSLTSGDINLFTDDTSVTGYKGTLKPTIGHEGTVTYTGIPSGTSIIVTEANSVQNVIYAVTETAGDASFTGSNIAYNESSNAATVAAQTAGTTNVDKTVAFTNTLVNISPTGVVLRIAPFAIILAAGMLMLGLLRRRKVEE